MVYDVAVSLGFAISSSTFSSNLPICVELWSKDLAVALELCFLAQEGRPHEREGAHAVQPNGWKWMSGPRVVVNCGYLLLPPSIFEPASPLETSSVQVCHLS